MSSTATNSTALQSAKDLLQEHLWNYLKTSNQSGRGATLDWIEKQLHSELDDQALRGHMSARKLHGVLRTIHERQYVTSPGGILMLRDQAEALVEEMDTLRPEGTELDPVTTPYLYHLSLFYTKFATAARAWIEAGKQEDTGAIENQELEGSDSQDTPDAMQGGVSLGSNQEGVANWAANESQLGDPLIEEESEGDDDSDGGVLLGDDE